jgi:hypothetical protein
MKLWGLVIILLLVNIAYAQDPLPVLYGQAFNGLNNADGAVVTVYPEYNESDTITDIVGITGKTALSGYWKVNLNNLKTEFEDNDAVAIHATNGQDETLRLYTVDTDQATHFVTINLDPSYNDYDEDGYPGDVDCNDNDATVNPGSPELADGQDNDCDGAIDEGAQIIEIFPGWTLFSLPLQPIELTNTEELGQAIIDRGTTCEVIMTYNETNQLWYDDILGLNDPSFALMEAEGYYIHCDIGVNFTYLGTLW